MKKLLFALVAITAITSSAFAKIIEVKATGKGSSEYAATMDAIDNAVRQSHKVELKNDKGVNLSETHIVMKDDTNLKIKSSEKGHVSLKGSSETHEKVSWWSRVKSWFGGEGASSYDAHDSFDGKASAEASYSYERKGGNIEYHDTSMERQIDMKYHGAIESYDIVSSKKSHGKWTVEIKAKVKQLDEYASPDLIEKAKYRVAIVPSGNKTLWNCIGSKKNSQHIEDIAIKELTNKIVSSKKMSVVDRQHIDKQLEELSLLNKDLANPDNANKLKQIAIADYMLIVTVDSFDATKTTKTLEMTGEKVTKGSANIEISYKLIETATMDIVASGSDANDMSLNSGSSCASVLQSLSKKTSVNLAEDLLGQLK